MKTTEKPRLSAHELRTGYTQFFLLGGGCAAWPSLTSSDLTPDPPRKNTSSSPSSSIRSQFGSRSCGLNGMDPQEWILWNGFNGIDPMERNQWQGHGVVAVWRVPEPIAFRTPPRRTPPPLPSPPNRPADPWLRFVRPVVPTLVSTGPFSGRCGWGHIRTRPDTLKNARGEVDTLKNARGEVDTLNKCPRRGRDPNKCPRRGRHLKTCARRGRYLKKCARRGRHLNKSTRRGRQQQKLRENMWLSAVLNNSV